MRSAAQGPTSFPFVGAVVQARTKSGRRWRIIWRQPPLPKFGWDEESWRLEPLGDDVRPAQDWDGQMNGGVRSIYRTTTQLTNPKRWHQVSDDKEDTDGR